MQNLKCSDGSEEDMDQKTTDAMVQSQHDCMVLRVCHEAYVEAQQGVLCVSAGHRSRRFQANFFDSLECSDHRSEEKVLNE